MKDRIKKIRKELDLTQQELAERIGVKRGTIANYEVGRNEPVDAIVSLICREFNINETWLRSGEGEMFAASPINELDSLAIKYNLTHHDYIFIEHLLKNVGARKSMEEFCIDYASSVLTNNSINPAAIPPDAVTDLSDLTIDQKVELYRQELENEEKVGAKSRASQENA